MANICAPNQWLFIFVWPMVASIHPAQYINLCWLAALILRALSHIRKTCSDSHSIWLMETILCPPLPLTDRLTTRANGLSLRIPFRLASLSFCTCMPKHSHTLKQRRRQCSFNGWVSSFLRLFSFFSLSFWLTTSTSTSIFCPAPISRYQPFFFKNVSSTSDWASNTSAGTSVSPALSFPLRSIQLSR